MKKAALIFGICLILLAGCVRVEQLLPEQEQLCLAPGDEVGVSVQVLPENVRDKDLLWTVDDASVAEVDQKGNIAAQSVGSCIVTVCSASNAEIFTQIGVVVLPHVEKITAQEELMLKPGQVQTISAQTFPQNVYDDSVKWSSDNETVATVDQQGTVTACAAGECVITVQSTAVSEVSAQIAVTVLAVPEFIQLNQESVSLTPGDSVNLTAQVMPENAFDRTLDWKSSDEEIAVVDETGRVTAKDVGTCTVTAACAAAPSISKEVVITVSAPTPTYGYVVPGNSVAGVTYINGILIANKTYALPSNYNPGEDPQAVAALYEMFEAALQDGITLFVKSGFRTYIDQYIIYNDWVAQDGQANADRYSARPGHSEHQSGLAFDLNDVSQAFADSPEGIWLAENCHKYGFIIRYPQDKEHITGYIYEPWHVRYLGKETAQAVYESGLCLEEYLGITSQYAD